MSIIAIDNYFPFSTGPGATATVNRWRLMARNWVPGGSGIIFGYLNGCAPSIAGGIVSVDLGGMWIDGFYGETTSIKTLSVSGNGMVVARMDPNAQVINFAFVPGQTIPVQNPTGIFEIPIAQITSGALADVRQFVIPTASTIAPTGIMTPFAGSTAPTGWLLCDGRAVLRTSYVALWGVIGTAFGAGDGSTTFNLPDTRGRTLVGAGQGTGLTSRLIGSRGGEESHVLSANENGWHDHGTWSGVDDRDHAHGVSNPINTGGFLWVSDPTGTLGPVGAATLKLQGRADVHTDGRNTGHLHQIPGQGGGAHNNMPPFVAINHIIKT